MSYTRESKVPTALPTVTAGAPRRRFANRQSTRAWSTSDWVRDTRWLRSDYGSATAEYAIATMAAVGFAGLLVVIMRGNEVRAILTDLVHRALTFAG
ncbi:MAG: DUF4244 domain-containing protein [Microbacteriaceae bacterium]|nr:DUF4244 domain-containing protein [Microbacteriaceae bacterium]